MRGDRKYMSFNAATGEFMNKLEDEVATLQTEISALAKVSLKATKALTYLNGMVSRGRGSDINSEDITANVSGYVMELEAQLKRQGELAEKLLTKLACAGVERLTELAPGMGWDSGEEVARHYIDALAASQEGE